ncbi:MAG: hypothetical protein ABIM54_00975 [candidate division WOR-3 bacterium]
MDYLIQKAIGLTFRSFFWWLVFGVIWALICSKIAEKQGRDTAIAAVLGFLFGLIAVLLYLIAGKKEKK